MIFDAARVAVARARAASALSEARDLREQATALEARAALLARTWGFEPVEPAGAPADVRSRTPGP